MSDVREVNPRFLGIAFVLVVLVKMSTTGLIGAKLSFGSPSLVIKAGNLYT